jgi:hypothetical protein
MVALVSIKNDEGTLKWFVDKFGTHQVSALTTCELQRWRDGLVSQPSAEAGLTEAQRREQLRASQASANRFWTVCRAALNFCLHIGARRCGSRLAPIEAIPGRGSSANSIPIGDGVQPTPKRQPYALQEPRAGRASNWVAPWRTGAPYRRAVQGNAARGGRRQGEAAPRTPHEGGPIILQETRERSPAGGSDATQAMRAAITAAKLSPAVFYDLRRSYGSLLANAGAGLSIIANALGHADTRMTKRHYAHLLDSVVAARLQAKLPTFRARSSRKAAA